MEYKVFLSSLATKDLQNIYNYIAFEKQSIINAKKLINKLKKEIADLSFMPNSYRLYNKEPFTNENVRCVPVNKYLIFYQTNDSDKTVSIVRVMYGKMDLSKLRK